MLRRLPLVLVLLLVQGCWLDFESTTPLLSAANAQGLLPDRFYASPVEKPENGVPDFTNVAPEEESLEGTCAAGLCALVELKDKEKDPFGELRARTIRAPYVLLQLNEDKGMFSYYVARFDGAAVPGSTVVEVLNLEDLAAEIAARLTPSAAPSATAYHSDDGKATRFEVHDISFFDGIVALIERHPERLSGHDSLYLVVRAY